MKNALNFKRNFKNHKQGCQKLKLLHFNIIFLSVWQKYDQLIKNMLKIFNDAGNISVVKRMFHALKISGQLLLLLLFINLASVFLPLVHMRCLNSLLVKLSAFQQTLESSESNINVVFTSILCSIHIIASNHECLIQFLHSTHNRYLYLIF